MVDCVRCRAKVPVGDTTFNEMGDYLCHRCTSLASLQQSVDAAEQNAIAQAKARSGGGIIGLIKRWFLVRKAKAEHQQFVASLPDVANAPSHCVACNAQVPRGWQKCDRCRAASK